MCAFWTRDYHCKDQRRRSATDDPAATAAKPTVIDYIYDVRFWPEAVIQTAMKTMLLTAAFGQKRTMQSITVGFAAVAAGSSLADRRH